jgi:hypothetical protein
MEQHETILHLGSFVQIKKFSVSNKFKKSFGNGDMLIVLKAQPTTFVVVIESSENESIPQLHEQWIATTITTCVIGVMVFFFIFAVKLSWLHRIL